MFSPFNYFARQATSRKNRDAAIYDANRLYMSLFEKWYNIILARFQWDGLPEGLTGEIIEKILFFQGSGAFFYSKEYERVMFLPIYLMGKPNVYNEIYKFGVRGLNGEPFTNEFGTNVFIDGENAALMKNTMNYYPTQLLIQYYIEQLVDIEGATKVNINSSKTPFIVTGMDNELLSMQNLFNEISSNRPVVYKEKGFDAKFEVHNLGYTFLADKFMEAYKEVETRLFSMIGINHTPFEKKERLVKDEVKSNDEYLFFSINTLLRLRQEACEKANKLFGLNMSVKLREVDIPEEREYTKDEEGDKDE